MHFTHEDTSYLTHPGVPPAFPEEPIEDPHQICRVLRTFAGRDKPSKEEVDLTLEFFSDQIGIVFTLTFMQKHLAALEFDWDTFAITRLSKYHPGIDLTEMEPLLWDHYTTTWLIMYHRVDKSFWGYCEDDDIDPDLQLVKLGYKWTDIALEYPCSYFTKAEEETRKRKENAKMVPNKRRRR